MLKKFLCMFAMAVVLVACGGSGPTGNKVLDDFLGDMEDILDKMEKAESESELATLKLEYFKEGVTWHDENQMELMRLLRSDDESDKKAMEIFEKESRKLGDRVRRLDDRSK